MLSIPESLDVLLWNVMESLAHNVNSPWMVGRYFNVIVAADKKRRGAMPRMTG